MPTKVVKVYYIKRKRKLMRNFEERIDLLKDLLENKYDNADIEEIINQMKVEFEKILPEIPYIGGQKNPMTILLIGGMYDLAIFRILEKKGLSFREIGQLYYEFSEKRLNIRKKSMKKIGKDPSHYPFEPEYTDMTRKMSEQSQKRQYADDWIMDFMEGDGKSFEWGFNFHQCGIYNVYKRLGAEKFVPFICLSDFSEANILGFGFTRTQTLGCGDQICDHRYVKNYKTPRAWPPDNIEEFKID